MTIHAHANQEVLNQISAPPPTSITTATTLYVAPTGSDTTGDGSSGNPWATVAKALSYLTDKWLAAEITISIGAGTYALSAPVTVNHPHSAKVTIQGATMAATTLSGSISVSGSSGAYSIDITVADASGISVGDYIGFYNLSGGTNPEYLYGCHEVTGKAGNVLTIASKLYGATAPAGAISGDVKAWKTKFTLSSGTAIDVFTPLKMLADIVIVGPGVSAGTGITLRPNVSVVDLRRIGMSGLYYGLYPGLNSSGLTTTSSYPCAISNCAYGIFSYGGKLQLINVRATGCTQVAITANYSGSIFLASGYAFANGVTNYSPALNTVGNANSYISG